jgi:hypothetical protein
MAKNIKITETIKWFDSDSTKTIHLAAKEYGFKIDNIKNLSQDEIKVDISGREDNIKEFMSDFEDGEVRPMCTKAHLSDDEYIEWLTAETNNY